MSAPRTGPQEGSAVVLTAGVLACAAIAVVAAPAAPAGAAWGLDAARFLPAPTRAMLVLLALGTPMLLLAPVGRRLRLPAPAATAVFVACFTVLAWCFRVGHVFLGDGIPITSTLPDTAALHPREPLSSWLLHRAWSALGPYFADPGRARELVVQDVVAVVSVAAGALYAAAAAGIARELARSFPGETPGDDRATVALATVTLAAPGAALVFFGYVEHYAWPAACSALFVWTALRALAGKGPLFAPLACLALAFALHFSSLVLLPMAVVTTVASFTVRERRGAALRDVALVLAAVATAAVALRLGADYDLAHHVRELAKSNRADLAYLSSRAHVRDFTNEHALLGPLGLFLALPLLVPFALEGRVRASLRAFVGTGVVTLGAATWFTPDMPLGYARDWDVFAAVGVTLAALALAMLFALVRADRARHGLLAAACAVTLLHTLPWVAVNHSIGASAARFATLPLGLGRTESTLAWWHMQRGDHASARMWIERSLRANPGNIRAVDLYGRIALLEGQPAIAVRAYRAGIALRPERPEYRLQLAFALHAAGREPEALAVLDTLERTHPDEPALWLQRAMGRHALGDEAGARTSLERALALNPALAATARSVLPSLMEGR
ncbi:MAG: tetratricopeptide repeat protein [Candidatus Eisenbacteria bacterium]|uniref:Tetratricopeptide repeat protein n=1 Tax=Eiseniibacteriota bacterium TaxID=2212470 RepID=A0A933W8S1_UNCEI|nr:tetratricopeptide repeat protein [Candidatus Eisenbacteria bacterium]